jgi:lysozyme
MTDEEFLEMLVRHEGVVPHAYQDSLGFWTIGVGRLIDKRKGGRLRRSEYMFMLQNDVDEVVAELDKQIPWWRSLTPNRQAVLANMAFNLGVKGLLGFKNTLAMIKSGDYEGAAKGMLNSKWAKQVDKNLNDHQGRANELADLMRNG